MPVSHISPYWRTGILAQRILLARLVLYITSHSLFFYCYSSDNERHWDPQVRRDVSGNKIHGREKKCNVHGSFHLWLLILNDNTKQRNEYNSLRHWLCDFMYAKCAFWLAETVFVSQDAFRKKHALICSAHVLAYCTKKKSLCVTIRCFFAFFFSLRVGILIVNTYVRIWSLQTSSIYGISLNYRLPSNLIIRCQTGRKRVQKCNKQIREQDQKINIHRIRAWHKTFMDFEFMCFIRSLLTFTIMRFRSLLM